MPEKLNFSQALESMKVGKKVKSKRVKWLFIKDNELYIESLGRDMRLEGLNKYDLFSDDWEVIEEIPEVKTASTDDKISELKEDVIYRVDQVIKMQNRHIDYYEDKLGTLINAINDKGNDISKLYERVNKLEEEQAVKKIVDEIKSYTYEKPFFDLSNVKFDQSLPKGTVRMGNTPFVFDKCTSKDKDTIKRIREWLIDSIAYCQQREKECSAENKTYMEAVRYAAKLEAYDNCLSQLEDE